MGDDICMNDGMHVGVLACWHVMLASPD